MTNTRPASCRLCGNPIQPNTGQSAPQGLPMSLGDCNKQYLCPPCYQWAAEYVPLYQSARQTRALIAPHIARIDEGERLVVVERLGQRERIHPQAAAWMLFDMMLEQAGLYCDKFAALALDHLTLKAPTTYANYKITLTIAHKLTVK